MPEKSFIGSGDVESIPKSEIDPSISLSERSNVKFKRQISLEADIAVTLDLATDEICNEFGEFSCINDVHHLALGGVDAYDNNIYNPQERHIATTPVILERIVLSACGERAKRDFSEPSRAIIFKGLQESVLSRDMLKQSIVLLYQRAFLRTPSPSEIDQSIGFYEVIANQKIENPALHWAHLSCYSVLTSVEFMFY